MSSVNMPSIKKILNSSRSTDSVFDNAGRCISRLEHIPAGEIWTIEEIAERKEKLLNEGWQWTAVDNLVIHEQIKMNGPYLNRYIDNYKVTLHNLAQSGIGVVGYNFMPVFYSVRTHFSFSSHDIYPFSLFDPVAFAAFDLYILKRPFGEESYTNYQKHKARIFNDRLSSCQKTQLSDNILECVQSNESISLQYLLRKVERYMAMGNAELINSLNVFRSHIMPLVNELNIKMHFKLDEPCPNLLGLPSVIRRS